MLPRRRVGPVTPKLPNWQKLAIGNAFAKWDPNGIEAAGNLWTDTASGMEGSITKGSAYPDPGDALGWSWTARDINGELFAPAKDGVFDLHLREITPPTLTMDCYAYVGIATESTLDSATVEAVGIGISWEGGGRTVKAVSILNGVATVATDATPDGLTRRVWLANQAFAAQGASLSTTGARGLNDAGTLGTDYAAANLNAGFFTGAQLYWWVAVGQTLATGAGAEPFEFAPFVFARPTPRSGLIPT